MEKIESILEKEYSEDKLEDFKIKTKKIYESLGYDFQLSATNIVLDKFEGCKVWVNENYANYPVSNLEIFEFNMSYPKILAKVANTNLKGFNEVYSKLFELYSLNKDVNIKKYINTTYGVLGNPNSTIYSNNIKMVVLTLNNMLWDILNMFKEHIVYIDTDTIVFRNFEEIKKEFEDLLQVINKYDLEYSYTKSKFGFFKAKKNYILEKDGSITIKGMKHFTSDGVIRGGVINIL